MPGQAIVTIRDKQWECWVASTPEELAAGLGGIPSIPAWTGMLFILPQEQIVEITAATMLFNLSIVFIGEDLKVTEVAPLVVPGGGGITMLPCKYFIEVNQSEISGIGTDDEVGIQLSGVPGAPDVSWITPVVTLVGVMMVGVLLGKMGKAMADTTLKKPKEKPLIYGPRGERLSPATRKEGKFIIGHDHEGNLIISHPDRYRDVFLQFESDRQIVYDILEKWELKEVEKGFSVRVKDTEPRASILNDLWDVTLPRGLPQTREKLYQRGADGYPVGADRIMREAWGPIPEPDQPFWSGKGFVKPARIYGWSFQADYNAWRAYVRFPDGEETWTSPMKQTASAAGGGGPIPTSYKVGNEVLQLHGVYATEEQADLEAKWIRSTEKVSVAVQRVFGQWAVYKATMGAAASKPARKDVEIDAWAERDRIGIWITDKRTDKTVAEWWDEDAREMFEQGWFKPGDVRHQTITGRAFEESVLDYAESVGLLAGSGKYLAQIVRDAYYWTAINKDTGEIVESLTPYTSSGRALRGGKAYASRHWKGTALIEVWRQPFRYSERLYADKLKIPPVVSETITTSRSSAVIPTEPRQPRPRREGELEFLPDSPAFLAYTIDDIGYREKIDSAFLSAIARARGKQ